MVQEFAAHRLAAEQSLRAEIEKLHQFRDAMVTLSICDAFGGTLRGFCERDEDDEDHDEAWEIAANVIQPIVIAEDIAAGRYSWVADEDESND